MVNHDPYLVILSLSIAVLGSFTTSVMTSNIFYSPREDKKIRLVMAVLGLGGSIWAIQFVGLLAIDAPINLAFNPLLLGLSGAAAFVGAALAIFLVTAMSRDDPVRVPVAVAVLGLAIALTQYLGLGGIVGRGLRLTWFMTAVNIAMSIQVAGIMLWFLFRRRGVFVTMLGSLFLGIALAATHYLAVTSVQGLDTALASVPPSAYVISERYLAWSATIMMYLLCSICLCIFVIMQFREEMQ